MYADEIIGILSILRKSRNHYLAVLVLNSQCFQLSLERCWQKEVIKGL